MKHKIQARAILALGAWLLASSMSAQRHEAPPINGAIPPTRASLREIPSEAWSGLPRHAKLPARVDMRDYLPPPGNQGRQNSCIAWSLAYGMLSYLQAREQQRAPVIGSGRMDSTRTYSPAFPYNLTKIDFDSTDTRCLGSNFDKVFSVMLEQGSCTWAQLPYDPKEDACFTPIPPRIMASAERGLLIGPLRVSPGSIDQLRYHLAQGTPIAFAMGIDTSFMLGGLRAARSRARFSWHPSCPTPMTGSHAMLLVGYDDADSSYLVMNSWGRGWGEEGFCHLRYEVIDCYATEAYVARYASPADAALPLVPLQPPSNKGTDDHLKARLHLGEAVAVGGIDLRLADHDLADASITMLVGDSADASAIERLDLEEDHPVRFLSGGDLITLEYTRASRKSDVRRTRAHITVKVEEDGQDPLIERALQKAALIRAARPGSR